MLAKEGSFGQRSACPQNKIRRSPFRRIFVYGVEMMAASEARLFSGFAVLNCCDAGIVRSPILA